jgi:hypothetical protein
VRPEKVEIPIEKVSSPESETSRLGGKLKTIAVGKSAPDRTAHFGISKVLKKCRDQSRLKFFPLADFLQRLSPRAHNLKIESTLRDHILQKVK